MVLLQNTSILNAALASATVCDVLLQILFALGAIMLVMCFAGLSVVAERKICAYIQGRYGPNRTAIPLVAAIPLVGNFLKKNGLMQLVADGLKFLFKEDPIPNHVRKIWYVAAPIMALAPVLVVAGLLPFGVWWDNGSPRPIAACDIDISLLAALAVSSLGVFASCMAGWSSNSKFPYLGAMRASAQVISFELCMGLSVLPIVLWISASVQNPLSLFEIGNYQSGNWWFCLTQPVSALIFLICLFAETNRLPFDMAESETDLVSGYHTEYGSFKFGLFFVGEYGHMVAGSSLFIVLFLGGWNPFPGLEWPQAWGWISVLLSLLTFIVKIAMMLFVMIWVRWTLPRFRYDQVMRIGWKITLPIAIANLVFYMCLSSI